MSVYAKEIKIEIIAKGRKYFTVKHTSGGKEFKLLINSQSEDFQVGKQYTVLCKYDVKVSRYGQKTTAIPVTSEEIEKENTEKQRQEILRWLGYIEDKAPTGYLYQTGLDKVKELGIQQFPELNQRCQAAIALANEKKNQIDLERWQQYVNENLNSGRIYRRGLEELKALGFDISVYAGQIAEIEQKEQLSEIERWSGYCEKAANEGRDYFKGLAKLRELGAGQRADELQELAVQIRSQNSEKTKQEQEKDGIIDYWFGSPGWVRSDEQTHLKQGDLFQHKDGNYYVILTQTRRYIREDGLSFGLSDDSGEVINGTARLATAEESAPLIEEVQKKFERESAKTKYQAERNSLIELIRKEGSQPEHTVGERILDTANLYGGGDWFEISESENEIWYCLNNGRDGDDWALNNVRTWGAGAIGWKIPFDPDVARRLRNLAEQKIN